MIKNTKFKRLPKYISPINYKLQIQPDLESSTFSGEENISIKIDKPTKKITLHSKDIDIQTIKFTNKKSEQFASKISYDTKKDIATFYFNKKINKGNGNLLLSFSGIINENLYGFYKSKYKIEGKEKFLLTTQFETKDARRAFPCFDEPDKKATFEISLTIPDCNEAISNTLPIEIKEHNKGFKVVSFSPTPRMSTYLLAFITGEFKHIEGYTKNNTQIRIFTSPNKESQTKFALDVAIRAIEFYEEYFDIPYPMPNLDLIAIPDFEAAGMENWGAITFRESSVLIDEKNSSLTNKRWVATTIAHEIAHQWFGNLVTMRWWTDLWLNEGFATYMEKICVEHLFPHWNVWNYAISGGRYRLAMEIDTLKYSHPIEVDIKNPDEIDESFDMVSYEKGGAIIRMLADYLGEEKFRNSIRYYLRKHSYGNTKTKNLWEAFKIITGEPVEKIMKTWTKQMGFPLIKIDDYNDKLKLSQERYFSSRISQKNNKKKYLWKIPLVLDGDKKILLEKKNILINKREIINKINKNESSFLRVKYTNNILKNIKKEIEKNHLSTIDKVGVIRDIIFLARGGYIKTTEALNFILEFKNEKEFNTWVEISSAINMISNLIDGKSLRKQYNNFAKNLYTSLIKELGFQKRDNDNENIIFLRNLTLMQSAIYDNEEVIEEAKKIFDNRIFKPIDGNIKDIIYNIIAIGGNKKEWDILKQLYLEEEMTEEKERYAIALTYFKDKEILQSNLEFAFSDKVRIQDKIRIIALTWKNEEGKDITWKFIRNNWDKILKYYGGGGYLISQLMSILGTHTKIEDLKDAKQFFSKNIAPGAQKTILQSFEMIESNIAWIRDDMEDIDKWLSENS